MNELIKDYKDFFKRNKDEIYTITTGAVGIGLAVGFFIGLMLTVSSVDRSLRNVRQLDQYRKDLAEYKNCAKKFNDPSIVDTYCGDYPSRPIVY